MTFVDDLIGLSRLPADALPARARALARLSLLDWMACGIAGREEPVAQHLRALAEDEGGAPRASVFGGGRHPARMAALVNGAASHALDYDDTHFAHVGHLSVAIYPAALALAEQADAPACDAVVAFLLGAEAAIRIGLVLGAAHYDLGFHQTATAGAFGATLAAGRLLRLEAGQMRHAVGLCATRASGLKSQFGTMGKPYNAGLAAAAGVECAMLAGSGMTSADDGLMGPQGFVATHTPAAAPEAGWHQPPPGRFLFEDNKYKLHACCHGTHAMIEALQSAPALAGLGLEDVAALALRTSPRWLRVCDLKAPRTGLEVKFSYAWLAGMAIRGDPTDRDRTFRDALARDADLDRFARKVEVIGDASLSDDQAVLDLTLVDGGHLTLSHDLAAAIPLDQLAARLRAKSAGLIGARGTDLWARFGDLRGIPARDLGRAIRG